MLFSRLPPGNLYTDKPLNRNEMKKYIILFINMLLLHAGAQAQLTRSEASGVANYLPHADLSVMGHGFFDKREHSIKEIFTAEEKMRLNNDASALLVDKAGVRVPQRLYEDANVAILNFYFDFYQVKMTDGSQFHVTSKNISRMTSASTIKTLNVDSVLTTRVSPDMNKVEWYVRAIRPGEKFLALDLSRLPEVSGTYPIIYWKSNLCVNPNVPLLQSERIEEKRSDADEGGREITPEEQPEEQRQEKVIEKVYEYEYINDYYTPGYLPIVSYMPSVSYGVGMYMAPMIQESQPCCCGGSTIVNNNSYVNNTTIVNPRPDPNPKPKDDGGPTKGPNGDGGPVKGPNGGTSLTDGTGDKGSNGQGDGGPNKGGNRMSDPSKGGNDYRSGRTAQVQGTTDATKQARTNSSTDEYRHPDRTAMTRANDKTQMQPTRNNGAQGSNRTEQQNSGTRSYHSPANQPGRSTSANGNLNNQRPQSNREYHAAGNRNQSNPSYGQQQRPQQYDMNRQQSGGGSRQPNYAGRMNQPTPYNRPSMNNNSAPRVSNVGMRSPSMGAPSMSRPVMAQAMGAPSGGQRRGR